MSDFSTNVDVFNLPGAMMKNLTCFEVVGEAIRVGRQVLSGLGTGYSAVLDTTNVKKGAASIKLTTPARGNDHHQDRELGPFGGPEYLPVVSIRLG